MANRSRPLKIELWRKWWATEKYNRGFRKSVMKAEARETRLDRVRLWIFNKVVEGNALVSERRPRWRRKNDVDFSLGIPLNSSTNIHKSSTTVARDEKTQRKARGYHFLIADLRGRFRAATLLSHQGTCGNSKQLPSTTYPNSIRILQNHNT
jgi:hypothetical protein